MSSWKSFANLLLGNLSPFQESSASLAKERLKIIVSHERGQSNHPADFLPALQRELIEVISKYVDVDKEQVKVELERNRDRCVLELNAILPERPESA